jgi:hypothetical protein
MWTIDKSHLEAMTNEKLARAFGLTGSRRMPSEPFDYDKLKADAEGVSESYLAYHRAKEQDTPPVYIAADPEFPYGQQLFVDDYGILTQVTDEFYEDEQGAIHKMPEGAKKRIVHRIPGLVSMDITYAEGEDMEKAKRRHPVEAIVEFKTQMEHEQATLEKIYADLAGQIQELVQQSKLIEQQQYAVATMLMHTAEALQKWERYSSEQQDEDVVIPFEQRGYDR